MILVAAPTTTTTTVVIWRSTLLDPNLKQSTTRAVRFFVCLSACVLGSSPVCESTYQLTRQTGWKAVMEAIGRANGRADNNSFHSQRKYLHGILLISNWLLRHDTCPSPSFFVWVYGDTLCSKMRHTAMMCRGCE